MRTIAGISEISASEMSRPSSHGGPAPSALREFRIHALIRAAQPLHCGVHLLLREPLAAHCQHELLAQRLQLRERSEFLLAHGGKARQECEIERWHPYRCGWYLVNETQQRPHMRTFGGTARRKTPRLRRHFVEIFDDDRGIDDDRTVVIERRDHAIGVEGEIVRFELIACQEIELPFLEW